LSRSRLETLKTVSTSEYWLIASLCGAFFSYFALNRGGVKVFMEASCFFLILNILCGSYRLKKIPIYYWILSAICGYLLLGSIVVSPQDSHYRWMSNVIRMIGVVFAIHCLSKKQVAGWVIVLFGIILSLTVCWQYAAFYLFELPAGTFSNTHRLAVVPVLTIPMIIYFAFVNIGWYRLIFFLVAAMAADLMLQTNSLPAFLGIALGTIFVGVFLVEGRHKWVGLAAVIIILVMLYITGYSYVPSRVEDLIVNLSRESRWQIWSKALDELMQNSLMEWLFGHGIGWFPITFTDNSFSELEVTPHLYVLELIYTNGLTGFILVFIGLFFLFMQMVKGAQKNPNKNIRLILRCLIVVSIAWLMLCGLNFPFYSKTSIYPLTFILGSIFIFVETSLPQKALKPKHQGNKNRELKPPPD